MSSVASIKKLIVIPTFKETESIKRFLAELIPRCSEEVAILIMDDSGAETKKFMEELCQDYSAKYRRRIVLDTKSQKSGRGAAVLRGFRRGLIEFPHCRFFVECDADSSHRPIDIIRVMNEDNRDCVVIGSRYLIGSEIIGWPASRRAFSRFLNLLVPRLLQVPVRDISNGLRCYPRDAIELICEHDFKSHSFIALSETALVLNRKGWGFDEVPTVFVNRVLGASTVTVKEIWESIKGLKRILKLKREL